jgi:hypothetical protein
MVNRKLLRHLADPRKLHKEKRKQRVILAKQKEEPAVEQKQEMPKEEEPVTQHSEYGHWSI